MLAFGWCLFNTITIQPIVRKAVRAMTLKLKTIRRDGGMAKVERRIGSNQLFVCELKGSMLRKTLDVVEAKISLSTDVPSKTAQHTLTPLYEQIVVDLNGPLITLSIAGEIICTNEMVELA